MDAVYRYAIHIKLVLFWLPFGVHPAKNGVSLTDDGRFVATYGFLRVENRSTTSATRTSPRVIAGGLPQERVCRSSTTD